MPPVRFVDKDGNVREDTEEKELPDGWQVDENGHRYLSYPVAGKYKREQQEKKE